MLPGGGHVAIAQQRSTSHRRYADSCRRTPTCWTSSWLLANRPSPSKHDTGSRFMTSGNDPNVGSASTGMKLTRSCRGCRSPRIRSVSRACWLSGYATGNSDYPWIRMGVSTTALPTSTGNCVRRYGQRSRSVHVDIVNSQPALLAVCLDKQYRDPRFPSGSGEGETRSDRAEPGGGESTTIYDAAPFSPIEGGDRYQRLATAGRLHEHLMAKTGMPRGAVKKGLLRDVFGKRVRTRVPWRTPSARVSRACTSSFDGSIATTMPPCSANSSAVESDLVIDRVGHRLHQFARCRLLFSSRHRHRRTSFWGRDAGDGHPVEPGGRGLM